MSQKWKKWCTEAAKLYRSNYLSNFSTSKIFLYLKFLHMTKNSPWTMSAASTTNMKYGWLPLGLRVYISEEVFLQSIWSDQAKPRTRCLCLTGRRPSHAPTTLHTRSLWNAFRSQNFCFEKSPSLSFTLTLCFNLSTLFSSTWWSVGRTMQAPTSRCAHSTPPTMCQLQKRSSTWKPAQTGRWVLSLFLTRTK